MGYLLLYLFARLFSLFVGVMSIRAAAFGLEEGMMWMQPFFFGMGPLFVLFGPTFLVTTVFDSPFRQPHGWLERAVKKMSGTFWFSERMKII